MKTRKRVTKREAEAVLAAVKKAFRTWIEAGYEPPTLRMDWDWSGEPTPTILWEGGPFEWTTLFPHGGRDEEFGFTIEPAKLPADVWTEPYSSYALSIYPL